MVNPTHASLIAPYRGYDVEACQKVCRNHGLKMDRFRKHQKFAQIPLDSPILTNALWMLQPARTGWQAEIYYKAFLTEYGLQQGDQIEA